MEKSSPSRTAGVVIREVTLGGTKFVLSQPDKVRRAADEEAVIISRRQMPAGLDPVDKAAAINSMMCGIATPEEWRAYWRSLWELAFRFWNALDPEDRKKHAGTDGKTPAGLLQGVRWAYDVVSQDGITREEIDDLWMAIKMVSQEEETKNS